MKSGSLTVDSEATVDIWKPNLKGFDGIETTKYTEHAGKDCQTELNHEKLEKRLHMGCGCATERLNDALSLLSLLRKERITL